MPTDTKVAQHTPGPWVLHIDELAVFGAGPDRQQVIDADACSPNLTADERKANARFIVTAVNAHGDMLQALLEVEGDCYALDEFSDLPHCRFCDHAEGAKHDAECVMQFVAAAIAKSEGR